MTVEAIRGDVKVEVEDEVYTLRFGGSALLALEAAFPGRPFIEVLNGFATAGQRGEMVPVHDVATIVRCALRRYHPNLTLDEAADLAFDPAMQVALGEAIAAAFPSPGEGGESTSHPPATPNRKARRGTATASLTNGSKPAAT